MKKNIFLTCVCAALPLLAACNRTDLAPSDCGGSIEVSFNLPEATRAAAQGNEAVITDVQLMLFDRSGNLYRHHSFTAAEITARSVSLENILNGAYDVYVIANGPDCSGFGTLDALRAADIDLQGYNDPASDFVMEGHKSIVVSGTGSTPLSIGISRYVSRVMLKSITNGIPAAFGNLTVERVFLSNVVGTQNLGGDKDPGSAPANWYNKEGRMDESLRNADHIINGTTFTASAAAMTFSNMAQSIANGGKWEGSQYFYAYPNGATAEPDGFKEPFAAQRSVLVIVASFAGRTYHYPVVLRNGLDRNTSYEISATITGAGGEDPNIPLTSGSLSVTVTVDNWIDGTSYTETF